jgi:heme exporter protein B
MTQAFWQAVFAILRKDLQAEMRSRELFNTMVLFALLSTFIFSFALEMDRVAREEAVSGVLWVTIVFASTLGLNRSMFMEREQNTLDAVLLAPISRTAVFVGKMLGNYLFTLVVGLVLIPIMSMLFNKPLVQPYFFLVLALGILGFSTVGTLISTMTIQTRARESLLPIAMLPVALPIILAAVYASTAILTGAEFKTWEGWVNLLVLINIIYLTLSLLLFEYVIEE